MPAKKKEAKQDEPAYVDEEGEFVHAAERAKYSGGVRRWTGAARESSGAPAKDKGKLPESAAAAAPAPAVMRHGTGTYVSPAILYSGEWVEDSMHGEGRLLFVPSGSAYTGSFAHGRFEGRGTYCWADGSKYEGLWRGSRMHGEGTYTDVNGTVYHGAYFNGTGPGLAKVYAQALAAAAPA